MKAMILAAGRGTRMRALTDNCPKPLLRVGGTTLIEWQIARLREAGLTDIVINHAYLGRMIEQALGDGRALGVRIRYSPEQIPLETAGGIRRALPLLGGTPFLVINGDVFCDADLGRLAERAATLGPNADLAHLLLVPNPSHNVDGDFRLDGNRIHPQRGRRLTFSGTGLYHPALFAQLPEGRAARLAPLLHRAAAVGRLGGSLHRGEWLDVGTPERLDALDRRLRNAGAAAH